MSGTSGSPVRAAVLSARVQEIIGRELHAGHRVDSKKKIIADANAQISKSLPMDLPASARTNIILNAVMGVVDDRLRKTSQPEVIATLETLFGKKFDKKLEQLDAVLDEAVRRADAATRADVRALTRPQLKPNPTRADVFDELCAVGKLAVMGEWNATCRGWLARATKVGVDLDLLDTYCDMQRYAWEVQIETIPRRLMQLAKGGQWDEALEATYNEASHHASRGQFGLSNAKAELDRVRQENRGSTRKLARQVMPPYDSAKTVATSEPPQHIAVPVAAAVVTGSTVGAARIDADAHTKAEEAIAAMVTSVLGSLEADANRAIREGDGSGFLDAAKRALDESWPRIKKMVSAALPKNRDAATRAWAKELATTYTDKNTWSALMDRLVPDLRLAETFSTDAPPAPIVYAGANEVARAEREQLISALVVVAPPANAHDETLLKQALNTFDMQMLRDLKNKGYVINVTRHLITYVEDDILPIVGSAEGMHRHDGPNPHITVRTYFRDGALQLDFSTLLHEIGHAYALRIRGTDEKPLYLDDSLVEAFKTEHKALPPYFHDQSEFNAETLGRYFADPVRCGGQTWLTKQAYDKMGFASLSPDRPALAALQRAQLAHPAINVKPDPFEFVEQREHFNALRTRATSLRDSYIIELDGSADQGADVLALGLASAIRSARSPETPPYGNGEELVRVSAETFDDAGKMNAILSEAVTAQRGVVLYIDDLSNIGPNAAGFAVLAKHVERFGGVTPLILRGTSGELDDFKRCLPTAPRRRFMLDSLTPAQVSENVVRRAKSEGFAFSAEAAAAFADRASSGSLMSAFGLWRNVKEAQQTRILRDVEAARRDVSAVTRITSKDVNAANMPTTKSPMERLAELPGMEGVRKHIDDLLRQLEECAGPEDMPRLNILFLGNPGTGKTTVAELLTQILYDRRLLKRNVFAKPLVSDIVKGDPEVNIKNLFEKNKGGVIFFDELHQLAASQKGKAALLAMIPYLGSADYRDTVFIGAGYIEKLLDLVREGDDGGEGRFPIRIPFDDFQPEAAAKIFDMMVHKRKRLKLAPGAFEAGLARIERERRCMMHFANGRTIEGVIEAADRARLARKGDANATVSAPRELIAEDFAAPALVSAEQALAQLDAIPGNAKLKAKLKSWAEAMLVARSYGEDPFNSISTNVVLRGPAGSSVEQFAHAISKLFAAYDVLPTDKVEELTGPDLQGKFVGQSAEAVITPYKKAWGGTVVVNNIGGLANAGGSFKDESVAKWLEVLGKNKRSVATIVTGSATEIAQFFAMNQKLAGAFVVLDAETMGVDDFVIDLSKQLSAGSRELTAAQMPEARRLAKWLVERPDYLGAADVEMVTKVLMRHQASQLSKLIAAGTRPASPRAMIDAAVTTAFEEIRDTRRQAVSVPAARSDANYSTETRELGRVSEDEMDERGASKDRVLTALTAVNKRFAEQYANDPKGLMAAQGDAGSDYAKALAEELGVSASEAVEAVAETQSAIADGVKIRKLQQRFVFHCPFCGGIESPSCAYIGMPQEWKIANSLRKPWTETVEEIIGGAP